MKQLATSYVFNKTAKTVTLNNFDFPLNHLLVIINATRQQIIYNLANPALGASNYVQGANSVVTLEATLDPLTENTDALTIFYDNGVTSNVVLVQGPAGPSGVAPLSDTAPLPLAASATPGTSSNVSRADHVHALPTPADIGAAAAGEFAGGFVEKARILWDAPSGHTGLEISDNMVILGGAQWDGGQPSSGQTRNEDIALNFRAAIDAAPTTNFAGANGTSAGTAGLVPLPAATDNTKFLKGDGTWAAVSGGASLTNTAPANLAATAAVGTSTEAARADHVHALPTPADIGALGLSTDSYIIVRPGDDLVAKYGEAKLLTPRSQPKSATNRATLFIYPGHYVPVPQLILDTEFVDVIGLGAAFQQPSVHFVSEYSIELRARDIRVVGISTKLASVPFQLGPYAGYDDTKETIIENCVGGDNSFSTAAAGGTNHTLVGCVGSAGSFSIQGSRVTQFIRCKLTSNQFPRFYVNSKMTWYDCEHTEGGSATLVNGTIYGGG